MARLPLPGRHSLIVRATAVPLTALLIAVPVTATGQPTPHDPSERLSAVQVSPIDAAIAEAAERFGVPARWIRAVIRAESAGSPCAVSRAGAVGLMQIMPGTWRELRDRHGLGDDPFDPRDWPTLMNFRGALMARRPVRQAIAWHCARTRAGHLRLNDCDPARQKDRT